MSKGNNVSIFEKYHDYGQKAVLLTLKVINSEDKIMLKHRYGEDFSGRGYLLKNEETRFQNAEKAFEKKLEKVKNMMDFGYSETKIINCLKETYQSPYKAYSSSIKAQQAFQLKNSFVENFPFNIQSKVEDYLKNLSDEEKNLINQFYWGKKYEILKMDIDQKLLPFLKNLINEIQDKIVTQNVKQNRDRKLAKISLKTSDTKKEKLEKIRQSKGGFLYFFEKGKEEEILKIVESFQTSNPNYYELIHKFYSGEQLENRNNITLTKQERSLLGDAKLKIKKILFVNEKATGKPEQVAKEKIN